jgi:hypothetical protein
VPGAPVIDIAVVFAICFSIDRKLLVTGVRNDVMCQTFFWFYNEFNNIEKTRFGKVNPENDVIQK